MQEHGEIRDWFDQTYRERGLGYLRPARAYPVFLDILDVRPGGRLLDVACGPGLLLAAARARGLDAHGVDLSPVAVDMVAMVAPGAEARLGNAEHLPHDDGQFDYVTCIGSVERFLDRGRALGEMRRVARPDARFCIMVRNADTLSWRLAVDVLGRRNVRGHQDADTLERWLALFVRAGFVIEAIYPDQWSMQELHHWLRLERLARYRPVAWPRPILRFANEFIFLLRAAR